MPGHVMYHTLTGLSEGCDSVTLKFAEVNPELPSVTDTSPIEMDGLAEGTQA